MVNTQTDAPPFEGPPIRSITTPYDKALMCLEGKIENQFTFAVGAVLDRTGREQFTLGGQGKYIVQGAGDIVQSALFKTGVTLLNRVDPRVMETDFKWGLRQPGSVVAVDFFVTGSINSLDFLPGGGVDMSVDGVGASYMSSRILVGLDLALTQAKTGRIVASVSLQKQIATKEFNLGLGRFFGGDLVSMTAGMGRRETLQFVQRQMLNRATFELLSQLLSPPKYGPCALRIAEIEPLDENLRSIKNLIAHPAYSNLPGTTEIQKVDPVDYEGEPSETSGMLVVEPAPAITRTTPHEHSTKPAPRSALNEEQAVEDGARADLDATTRYSEDPRTQQRRQKILRY